MRNMQLLDEEPWQSLCVKELGGLKKLKRKHKEPPANGYKSFKVALKVSERAAGGRQLERPASLVPESGAAGSSQGAAAPPLLGGREAGSAAGALDMRKGAFPAAGLASQPPRKEPGLPPAALNGLQPCPGEQSLPSRLVLCPPPPQRPLESAYASVAHGAYNSTPESAASPRKRLGEPAGVSSEIKAIQQTRRLLANARERTRVHTISAAFEALRKQVPCYSYGQKLSKLAILRIACNYILSLARLADMDYSADHSNMSFSECVEQCTRTLQAEGRSKKRKLSCRIINQQDFNG
ncbi:transcription factor ATOH8 isoform X2 [Chrysemys picta bellii]|uniref:transcription factor ATOH8 isoform X2 n=1 Tax=Chrysemys picta bellii TaxID=8478 RepID=UPI001C66BA61|nr:protein atonal homolog 8 isoform X2 [Chrysemys picta bellii]